jgi:hypothetical protein
MTPAPAAPHTQQLSLQDWLTALLSADPVELRMVAIRGIAASMAMERVRCCRHGQTFNWMGAYRHLADTELAWRNSHPEDGDNAALHVVGDLRPATPADAPPRLFWETSQCSKCHADVVWALTPRGKSAPINAGTDPAGNVLLVAQESATDPPRAVYLHTEAELAEVPVDRLHTPHHATCAGPEKKVRR